MLKNLDSNSAFPKMDLQGSKGEIKIKSRVKVIKILQMVLLVKILIQGK